MYHVDKMAKLVLCLSLFLCVFGVSFGQTAVLGGFQEADEGVLNNLFVKLRPTFEQLSQKYSDFDFTLKEMLSGKYQDVQGTRYIATVEVTSKANPSEVKRCEIDILENLQGEFDQVTVKFENNGKTFTYTKA